MLGRRNLAMAEDRRQMWKMTAIGLAIAAIVAVVTGIVVANRTGTNEAKVAAPSASPSTTVNPQVAQAPTTPPPAAQPTTPATAKATEAQWSTTQAKVEHAALTADREEAGRVVRDVMLEGFRDHVEHYVKLEPVYRFPVLTHWSFTVSGSGGFQPLILYDQRQDAALPADSSAARKGFRE